MEAKSIILKHLTYNVAANMKTQFPKLHQIVLICVSIKEIRTLYRQPGSEKEAELGLEKDDYLDTLRNRGTCFSD